MATTGQSPDTPTKPDGSFDAGPYYVQLRISDYVRPTPFAKPKREKTYTVRLPIPTELREESPTEWSSPSLGVVGDLINGDFLGGAGSAVLSNIGKAPGAIMGGVLGDGKIARAFTSAVDNVLPAENITSAVQQSFGIAPNPNQTMTFQGPQLRTFTFSWTFNPRTKEESKRYQAIINKIRARSLPTYKFNERSAILKYPSTVLMNFYPWDSMGNSDNTYYGWSDQSIIKMKTCVINNVIVNYAPGNIPAFFEGTRLPTVIQLTITLRETEYMLGGDYDKSIQTKEGLGQQFLDLIGAGNIFPLGIPDVLAATTPPADKTSQEATDKAKDTANAVQKDKPTEVDSIANRVGNAVTNWWNSLSAPTANTATPPGAN